jgi:hypothetical protein
VSSTERNVYVDGKYEKNLGESVRRQGLNDAVNRQPAKINLFFFVHIEKKRGGGWDEKCHRQPRILLIQAKMTATLAGLVQNGIDELDEEDRST